MIHFAGWAMILRGRTGRGRIALAADKAYDVRQAKVDAVFTLALAAYNLIRLPNLLAVPV